jgi:hypothetical protein
MNDEWHSFDDDDPIDGMISDWAAAFLLAVIVAVVAAVLLTVAYGRELYPGAWSRVAKDTGDFLSSQRRPPMKPWTGDWHHDSCCGPADAYETDLFDSEDGNFIAIITEGDTPEKKVEADRTQPYCQETAEDEHGCKPRIPPGTRIVVPKDRILPNDPEHPNPTGHGWIWLSSGGDVFCYATPSLT